MAMIPMSTDRVRQLCSDKLYYLDRWRDDEANELTAQRMKELGVWWRALLRKLLSQEMPHRDDIKKEMLGVVSEYERELEAKIRLLRDLASMSKRQKTIWISEQDYEDIRD